MQKRCDAGLEHRLQLDLVQEERGRERDRFERQGGGNGLRAKRVKGGKVKARGIHPTAEGRTRPCGCTVHSLHRKQISQSIIFYLPKRKCSTFVNMSTNMAVYQRSCRAHQAGQPL